MKYAAKTITGIRKQNQDAVFIPESGMIAIAAVADGMGGHNAGDIASALAIKTLVENMHKKRARNYSGAAYKRGEHGQFSRV